MSGEAAAKVRSTNVGHSPRPQPKQHVTSSHQVSGEAAAKVRSTNVGSRCQGRLLLRYVLLM